MKTQKGVTLVSLTVYVVALTIIVAIMSIITTNFYSNIGDVSNNIEPYTEYIKFNTYFSEETNNENVSIIDCTDNYIVFDDEVQYTFVSANKGIYKNKVKICKNVTSCKFSTKIENGKEIVNVELTIGDKEYKTSYTLKK